MSKSLKPCQRCQKNVDIRYRVQSDDTKQWQLICVDCWRIIAPDNPFYRYGGTWKAK
jgi:hypothetical protein